MTSSYELWVLEIWYSLSSHWNYPTHHLWASDITPGSMVALEARGKTFKRLNRPVLTYFTRFETQDLDCAAFSNPRFAPIGILDLA